VIGAPTGYTLAAGGPRVHEALLLFTLPDTGGWNVRLWDFKQRRPVVPHFVRHAPGPAHPGTRRPRAPA